MSFFSPLIIYALLFVAGVTGIVGCWQLPFLDDRGIPGPGFFPIVLGIAISILSMIQLIGVFVSRNELDKSIDKSALKRIIMFYALLFILTILISQYIGLLPSLGIFTSVALCVWGDNIKIVKSIVISIVFMVIIYFSFSKLLKVNFPMGELFEAYFRGW